MDQLVRDEVERLDSTESKTLFIGTTFENIATRLDWLSGRCYGFGSIPIGGRVK